MEKQEEMCFDCLHRRISSDFSGKLIFSYGSTDSPLPFASSAVVSISSGEPSSQFIIKYMPCRNDDCLAKYINEYCPNDVRGNIDGEQDGSVSSVFDQVQAEVSVGIPNDKNASLDTEKTECKYFSDDGRNTSFFLLGCEHPACRFSGRFSCMRTITALAPSAWIGSASYELFEELASDFLSGSVEDHILQSLCSLIEGKATSRDGINFLGLIGIPTFEEDIFPGCIRHPNITPILGMLKSCEKITSVLPKTPYTLENILHFSPGALKSDWHVRFLVYQLLSAVAHMHGLGVAHGNLCPSNILLTDSIWCWLRLGEKQLISSDASPLSEGNCNASNKPCCTEGCTSSGLYADLELSKSEDWWPSSFYSWWKGELSNFEYLLLLNRLAGRRWGDHAFYPVMPWVVDFSVKPDENSDAGWRDLSKSKWRLAKGDEQLDFTYLSSEIPHHVSDECLSELAVCSYKARRLPLNVLRTAVRSVYEPNEYPSSMQRLYQWTPDESIPEFYCDPQIFYSVHSGMSDLAVPSWARTPEEFIKFHRDALESERVSRHIHHWIDITFGYKMSGEAAIAAKNVMLPASGPVIPRSVGRRQLFTQPHPARRIVSWEGLKLSNGARNHSQLDNILLEESLTGSGHLNELEEATSFCEHARHLTPLYNFCMNDCMEDESLVKRSSRDTSKTVTYRRPECGSNNMVPSSIDVNYLLKKIEEADATTIGYQELLLWRKESSCSKISSKRIADDIFSVGCILAELHLRKPLFDPASLNLFLENNILPRSMNELSSHTRVFVEACIQKDWSRRPSAKCLLESPLFTRSVRSPYLFLAPCHLLAKDESRLHYAATFAKQGVLRAMGMFGAEMCAPYCLPFVLAPTSDAEAEWAYILLAEFLKCLNVEAVQQLVLPAIQKILQATGYSRLKVSLLQGSFVQEIWNRTGKQTYLEKIHPLIISNLCVCPHKSSTAAASVLLIGSSEELGVPITVHQTILPLILFFGKGLCSDGLDVVIRIGSLFGENFIVKHILPLLRNVVHSCLDSSYANKPEPVQSWGSLALMDCLTTLDGLVSALPKETITKELIEDESCLFVMILLHKEIENRVLQAGARSLIRVCQQIGPDFTALHVLPKLKELFNELAFSQENSSFFGIPEGNIKEITVQVDAEYFIQSRMDLVLLLYPPFASLLGIERLRQCCPTWLLLEQFLLYRHNWKWEYTGDSSRTVLENTNGIRSTSGKSSASQDAPSRLLLNGIGWSMPQSQGKRGAKNSVHNRWSSENHHNLVDKHVSGQNFEMPEPWYWFPTPAASWNGFDVTGRGVGPKDELPWKIRASILQSVRAHHGALRSFAICQDEYTFFTAGIGVGFKGTILKWELSKANCVSSYNGHEEVVNDICVLASSGRVASCDGTIHVWNGQTGKLISAFSESSSASAPTVDRDEDFMLDYNPSSSGMLNTAFHGSSYTTIDYMEYIDRLVVGTGSGSLRFIDVNQGQKLNLWKSEPIQSSFPPLISSICSCGSAKGSSEQPAAFPSWIAAGLSSGHCKMFDMRSGQIIASWQAHDGYVTRLAAAADHLLVSSSLDKTLRVWDLRRKWTSEPIVFRGHSDGVSGFSIWGQDVISICKNKIGVASLASATDEDWLHRVTPLHLYTLDRESKNTSTLSSICILPFSRLFLVGTEDGYMKICC